MARIIFVLIGILATQNVNCAPSDTIDEKLDSEHDEPALNDKSYSILHNNEKVYGEKLEVHRQKRTFLDISHNYPPYYVPHSNIRLHLQKLQEKLQNKVKLPYHPPPLPNVFPVYEPNRVSQVPGSRNPVTSYETTTQAAKSTYVNINPQNKTVPALHNGPPEIEDERQIWGLVINNTATDRDDNDHDNDNNDDNDDKKKYYSNRWTWK
ncbi:unnamed protein product [Parnassius apollo]|uniref:(apollo) hypothetical protein n=1 Tax=Parnassius apollo TaxID=110799 RepID=A0A8S3WE87_PARAO|nr:unnamed protein product [Parnassius apollo]